ncbi:hypothetical protein ATCC90586_010590 [Pythium insidiosum]|nr:hypothetical protein ATCC90586_010590 [Pythium insidiosum]
MAATGDGIAAFSRHWHAQQTAAPAKGDEQERQARLFKGLLEAKTRVDQVVIEDSKFPDLYDQLATQSEPQNYFFEPYATQWCPQLLKKGAIIPLPSVIATSMEEEMQTLTLSGLLTPIDHAWTSVDHRLFLWNYKQRGRFAVFEFDQPVVAVGLCQRPRPGVFTDKVQHLLAVATTVEVVLVAVLYEDNKTLASGLRLQRTKLSVSTDNTVVRRIVATASTGRIFFGGSDGGVYEIIYGPTPAGAASASSASSSLGLDTSIFIPSFLQRSACRKVTHTSHLANYLPSFLSALTSSAGKILEFALDEDRQILYALHDQGDIDVFDLGAQGRETQLVCTVNLLAGGAKYARATAAKAMIKGLMKGRNENNQFLIRQLREQCPSYFTVSDLWHYQGHKSLALAKLSAPSGRATHLNESLSQFLQACHMWDTEECIEVLQGICDDYALLNFYEGVVKLALACAKNFHDAAATDLTGSKLMLKRSCLGCVLLVLQRVLKNDTSSSPQAVDEMVRLDEETRQRFTQQILHYSLASEDSDFHLLLYSWLYEHGETKLLTSIRSQFIESFLKEKDQDLLIKMYMEQQKYLVAAKVWWSRAHEDNEDMALDQNPDIVKRQYYVSKAMSCLKSIPDVSEAADAIREVRDVLDVLQLQVRILKSLEQATIALESSTSSGRGDSELRERRADLQQLTYKIFDASTLYNQFASKYDIFVFPVGFLAKLLERISAWYIRVANLPPSAHEHREIPVLLEQFRRFKSELMSFRNQL